ncbi:hypothetical protein [Streptomyces sp. NPDC001930]|uniref:hypothetical protein n=1 Tax=Streptomyces sp. NPDC001930 TaxID=3364625 RepID=UPI0036B84534
MNPSHQPADPPPAPTSSHANSNWVPWLLVMILFSTLVAACTGFLTSLTGAPPSMALLQAGAAFGGSAILCLAAVPAIHQLRKHR